MPNHVHGVIMLVDDGRGGSPMSGGMHLSDETPAGMDNLPINQIRPYVKPKPRHGLSEIIRAFKSLSARRINRQRRTDGIPVWQRNYYEQIIRNERHLTAVQQYIHNNPANWTEDDYFVASDK